MSAKQYSEEQTIYSLVLPPANIDPTQNDEIVAPRVGEHFRIFSSPGWSSTSRPLAICAGEKLPIFLLLMISVTLYWGATSW